MINCLRADKTNPRHIIRKIDLPLMKPGAVIVDVSCEYERGVIETSIERSWDSPTYVVDGVTHLVLANLPSAVPFECSSGWRQDILPVILETVRMCRSKEILPIEWMPRGIVCQGGRLLHTETLAVYGNVVR